MNPCYATSAADAPCHCVGNHNLCAELRPLLPDPAALDDACGTSCGTPLTPGGAAIPPRGH